MKIVVPKDLGGSLRNDLTGTFEAVIADMFLGESRAKQPKITARYILKSEMEGPHEGTTIGETVLESFSLQEQAIWKLNDLYKLCAGERLPQGDFDLQEFFEKVKEACVGKEVYLSLAIGKDQNNNDRVEVEKKSLKQSAPKVAPKEKKKGLFS